MTANEPTLPPERVEELIRFLHNEGDGGIWEELDRRNAETVAGALSPLIAGWLTEAYSRGVNDTFDTDGALMKAREQGAAEVRERVDAAVRLVSPDHITPMGARQIRAVLATEREERR